VRAPAESSVAGARWDISGVEALAREACRSPLLERCRALSVRYAGRLDSLDAPELRSLLDELGVLWGELAAPAGYVELRVSLDAATAERDGLVALASAVVADATAALRSFDDQWLALPEESARRILRSPALASYRHVLGVRRRFASHALGDAAERALASRDAAATDAWVALYDRTLASACGVLEGRELAVSELLGKLRAPDREVRAGALAAIATALRPQLVVLAHCLDALVSDRLAVDMLRGFRRPRDAIDLENELEPQLVDALLASLERRGAIARRWFREKARLLDSRLAIVDEYAPLGRAQPVPLAEARAAIVAALGQLEPELADVADSFFTDGRVDAEPRAEKASATFCVDLGLAAKPYVMVSYRDRFVDALRLAHEVGHGVHFELAARAQPPLVQEPSVAVAEVAATFVQHLVAEELVRRESDPDARRAMVATTLEFAVDALFCQTAVTRFEDAAYSVRASGETLTVERLGALWLECHRRYYGTSLDLPRDFSCFWACAGQLFRARYYGYAYVVAQVAALLLRRRMRIDSELGARFAAFLEQGGAADPIEQLATLGVDLARAGVADDAVRELRAMFDAAAAARAAVTS